MLSGRKALSKIDRSLQTVRNDAVRLDQKLSLLSGQVTMNEQRRLSLLDQIAQVRLSEIERGELRSTFDLVDTAVQRLLLDRTTAFEKLNQDIDEKNKAIEVAEQNRDSELARYNEASQALLDVEAKVQAELKLNVGYLEQVKLAQQAESVAEEAEQKVETATRDLAEKAKPYQADPLFMYLWKRGYGTTEYSAGLFSRFMDGRVAKLIKYEPARVNFWNLNEIPKRLQEHAERVGELADQEFESLQQLEQRALTSAGAQDIEQNLASLRNSMDTMDDSIEAAEAELNELLTQRSEYSAGEDRYSKECISKIFEALKHQNLESVNRYVRQTHSQVDDKLVLELRTLEDDLTSLQGDLSSVRKLHNNQISKLRDLEGVRHQFKNSRFDDVRSGFKNEDLIGSVLNQFLQGVISGADLWGTIKRNQRYREQQVTPDFGSGGVGDLIDVLDQLGRSGTDIGDILAPRAPKRRRRRRSKGSTWHVPSPRRGGGGFKLPRASRGRSSGGFKTGGGF